MNKKEMVASIKSKLDECGVKSTNDSIEQMLLATVETITQAVAEDDKVTLNGFGSFSRRLRKESMGRNPRTGEEVSIPAHYVVQFSPSSNLKKAINPEE